MHNKIREARKAAGLTQEQLSERLDIKRATLSRYESGTIDPPASQLKAIAGALGVSLDYLTGVPDSLRAMGIDQAQITPRDVQPSEFNEFERFIETLGYRTTLDGDNYRLQKGRASVVITPDQLKGLVRASRATVAALVQDLMETATPFQKPTEGPQEGE